MTHSPPDRSLTDLADLVAEQFSDYRHSEEFNELSLVIDNSDRERPLQRTLKRTEPCAGRLVLYNNRMNK